MTKIVNDTLLGVSISKWGVIKWQSFQDIINKSKSLINTAILLGGLVAAIMLVVSGYTMITSGGDPEKYSKGVKGLTAAIIGLIIVFLAVLLTNAASKAATTGGL